MRMQYRDGTIGDDPLFNQPEDLQRVYIAGCMGFNCFAPEDWLIEAVEKMLLVRRCEGLKVFHEKLRQMYTP